MSNLPKFSEQYAYEKTMTLPAGIFKYLPAFVKKYGANPVGIHIRVDEYKEEAFDEYMTLNGLELPCELVLHSKGIIKLTFMLEVGKRYPRIFKGKRTPWNITK